MLALSLLAVAVAACDRRAAPRYDRTETRSYRLVWAPHHDDGARDAGAAQLETDAPRPAWVPPTDRLTIVSAEDRDKNLGLRDADAGASAVR